LTAGVCIIHLIRNTFRLASRRYWDEMRHDIKPLYTAVNATAARLAFDDLAEKWGQRYPAVVRLWDNAWAEFIRSLDYDVEIVASSAAPTRSSRSTPAVGGRSKPAVTSSTRSRLTQRCAVSRTVPAR